MNQDYIETLKHKARMAEVFMAHPRNDGIREAAQTLGIDKFILANWLIANGIIDIIDYDTFPAEAFILRGYATFITGIAEDGVFHQPWFTATGLVWIAKHFRGEVSQVD